MPAPFTSSVIERSLSDFYFHSWEGEKQKEKEEIEEAPPFRTLTTNFLNDNLNYIEAIIAFLKIWRTELF